jgi:hypothetical protein
MNRPSCGALSKAQVCAMVTNWPCAISETTAVEFDSWGPFPGESHSQAVADLTHLWLVPALQHVTV